MTILRIIRNSKELIVNFYLRWYQCLTLNLNMVNDLMKIERYRTALEYLYFPTMVKQLG